MSIVKQVAVKDYENLVHGHIRVHSDGSTSWLGAPRFHPKMGRGPLPRCPVPPSVSMSALAARLQKAIGKAREAGPRASEYLGKHVGQGFCVVETDGHRALCRKGEGPQGPELIADREYSAVVPDPEFWLAVKRAAVMSVRMHSHMVKLEFSLGQVSVVGVDPDYGEAVCECPCAYEGPLQGFALNSSYLLAALGHWPVELSWDDAETQVQFTWPDAPEWVLAMMPCRL